ncbi:MAG: hypothetical protein ACI86M_002114 [Saprospiraceae bacterium]|jgi:uncharacterized protein YbbC (DUF1343 family)
MIMLNLDFNKEYNMFCFTERMSKLTLFICMTILITSCHQQADEKNKVAVLSQKVEVPVDIIVGAQNVAEYHPLLEGKTVGMVVNQTSVIDGEHLVDSLLKLGVNIKMIFAPEHGFRGEADAGEQIKDSKDAQTGIPVVSLYGKKKKPVKDDLAGIDVIVFDIQDVGARFYTYISSLHYVMEACAENGIPIIVLDRPNPNGHYVDGPILEKKYKSFVGMHPVPVVYGMTIGEYAQMINGEGWLDNGAKAELTIIKNREYTRDTYFNLPIKPSPNLPNIQSIFLYPSLCFFEGTMMSVGRGTNTQFQVMGHPNYEGGDYTFTPITGPGAKYPKHENKVCRGRDLTKLPKGVLHELGRLDLSYLIESYNNLKHQDIPFFNDNNFFEKLAGTLDLRTQIKAGKTEEVIRATWQDGLVEFEKVRGQYLLYE